MVLLLTKDDIELLLIISNQEIATRKMHRVVVHLQETSSHRYIPRDVLINARRLIDGDGC